MVRVGPPGGVTAVLAACMSLVAVPAWSQASSPTATRTASVVQPGGPSWSSLTAAQRNALAPLERDWAGIDRQRKAKWLEIASRFPGMPADEQQRVHERMAEWTRMSPAERDRARLSYQAAKGVPPQDRQASWEAYQALPDAERKAMAARAASAPAPANAPRLAPPRTAATSGAPGQGGVKPAAQATAFDKPVAPAMVQATPGATTIPMTRPPAPPAHQQPGAPKVADKPSQVDRSTLLPRADAAASAAGGKPPSSTAPKR